MGPLCIRRDGLDREYGNPNYSWVPRGPWHWLESYVAPRRRSERESFQKSLNRSGASAV